MAAHGTRSRYREGCRCTTCKEAESAYYRQHRDRGGAVKPLVAAAGAPGRMVQAIEAQLAGLSAAQDQPALAALALSLAEVMDGPIVTPKPAAAGKLLVVLDALRKGSDLRRSGLASVRAMSRGDRPGSATG